MQPYRELAADKYHMSTSQLFVKAMARTSIVASILSAAGGAVRLQLRTARMSIGDNVLLSMLCDM